MLPLDILGAIFTEYGKQETLDSQLETLLLVCRTWRDLCLDLKLVWSSFNIVFGTAVEAEKWASLVPKRLARSGKTAPIHAVITNNRKRAHQYRDVETGRMGYYRCPALAGQLESDPEFQCSCHIDIPEHIASILNALAGEGGELCSRWVTLSLSLHMRGRRRDLFRSLSYSTPNLRTLTLQGIDSSWPGIGALTLFPDVPLLCDLSLQHSNLPHLHTGPRGPFQTGFHLQRLELQDYTMSALMLSTELPSLTCLVLRGNWWHRTDTPILVPNLTSLTREMTMLNLCRPYDCFVIPFEKLGTLGIFCRGHSRNSPPALGSAFTDALLELFISAKHAHTIAGDEFSILTLLLILSVRPYGSQPTTRQLRICVMDRRHAGRVDWALENGHREVYTVDMGKNLLCDIENIKKRKGWSSCGTLPRTRPRPPAS